MAADGFLFRGGVFVVLTGFAGFVLFRWGFFEDLVADGAEFFVGGLFLFRFWVRRSTTSSLPIFLAG